MKLINIIRFIRGYVCFTATGGFPERFINLCNINKIRIWNIDPAIGYLNACVSAPNFRKLRSLVKSSGINIKITRKSGLPFLIKKYSNRKFLFAGVIFYFIFIFAMNQFVWITDVIGTEKISHEEIISVAKQYSLSPGILVTSFDETATGRSCINHFGDRIVWMAINIKGSKAVIEVRDYIDEHEDTTYGDPCNIVADFEGKILSIETYNGDKAVTSGSGVKKGDLLISGVIENTDLSCDYVEARGKITALHSVSFSRSYKKSTENIKQIVGVRRKYRLNFLWADIPMYTYNKSNNIYSFNQNMMYSSIKLPFGIVYEAHCTLSDTDKKQNDFLPALDSFTNEYYEYFRNTKILDTQFNIVNNKNKYTVSAKTDCIDFMGIKKDIYTEKTEKIY